MDDRPRAPRRPAPAYQEYAADMLAAEKVREMSLEEVGLLAAMRWACWSNNGDIPREPERIARLLGKDPAEVQRAMTDAVMSYFEPTARTPSRLHCPELTHQRARLHERSAERSKSGRRGASARWEKKNSNSSAMAKPYTPLRGKELTGGKVSSPAFTPGGEDDEIPF